MDSKGLGLTPDIIEKAVQQFYREPTNENLNGFLTQAQFSKEAWFFCWELLKTNKPTEVQYYGANTLHLKISKHWFEIPEDYILSLRESLLKHLESHGNSTRAIIIKICVCLACFILQTMSQHWPNALQELITSAMQPCGDDLIKKTVHQKIMLEILTVIPEELPGIYIPQANKSQVHNELLNASGSVLHLICKLLVEGWPQESVKIQAIKCFTSWLHLDICVVQPDNESLVYLLFDQLRSPTFFADVSEALMQLFKSPLNHKYPRTLLKYLKKVTELGAFFDSESHDIEVTQSLTRIFVSAAENNIDLLLTSLSQNNEDAQISLNLLQLIIKTISIKGQYSTEELCSDLSFGFWYNLQDEVTQKSHPPHVLMMMKDMFLDMFNIMTVKTRYPPDREYSQWGIDDKEVFRCYRQDFADAAAYFSSFIGEMSMNRMLQLLTNQLTKLHNNIEVDWQEFDGIIYIMTSIMEGGNLEVSIYTSEVYSLLPYVPCTHATLITQIMFFIGSCAGVMDEGMFAHSIDFILKGLPHREISSAASMSLKDLLLAHKDQIPSVSEAVLQGLKLTMEREDLEPSDYVRLANCLGYVLSIISEDQAIQVIEVIIMPHVNTLFNLVSAAQVSSHDADLLTQKIKLMAGFFYSFTMPDTNSELVHPNYFIFRFLQQFLPCVKQIIVLHIQDENIMNELFELLKRITSSMIPYFGNLVPEFSELIKISYNLSPLPCILELAKAVFIVSSTDERNQDIIKSTFASICNKSLQILGDNPQNYPDVVDAFMNFLSQISKKAPSLLKFEYECAFRLFSAAMVGVAMKENQASRSSCQFLSSLILNADLTQIVQVHGRKLLEMLILAIAVNLPRHNLSPLTDVISALLTRHFDFVVKMLPEIMSRDQFPVARATPAEKQQFVKRILASQKCKRKLKEAVNEFAMLWRGILHTEYGAQTSAFD